MNRKVIPKRKFNKTVFCLYQSTSDDLMVWCWFDVIILSLNYGFEMTEISLLFSVAFWVSMALKLPANVLARKVGAGRSVLLSAVLFLMAALLLTFGHSLPVAIIGQSIYLVAGSFQEMSTVIARNAAERDPTHIDYMKIMSVTGTIYSVISMVAALFMSRLYAINENLPMYICVGFCLNSCILAYLVSGYDADGSEKEEQIRRKVLPGVKIRTFDKTTLSCLFLSILFMVIFTVSGDNLKIMIEHDLSGLADKHRTVFLFSMLLLVSRVVKILSNLLLYASRNIKIKQERSFFFIVTGVVLIALFGFLDEWGTGYYAILLSVAAFLIRVLVFDPFRFNIYDFMLKRLSNEKMINVLFVQSTGSDLFTALFSSIGTLLLNLYGMHSVMFMLLIISIIFAVSYILFHRNLVRTNGNRSFTKWKWHDIESSDSQMMAAAALFMHYGVVQDSSFTPEKMKKKISSLEDLSAVSRSIRLDGYYEYDDDTLRRLFYAGQPCMVRAVINEGKPACWLAVMYLDDDGGVIWNPYSEERFLAELHQICEICSFKIRGE